MDHILAPEVSVQDFSSNRARRIGAGRGRGWLRIERRMALPAGGRKATFSYRIRRLGKGAQRFLFGSELRLRLLDAHFNRVGEAAGVKHFSVVDPLARIELCGSLDRPARLWHFPREARVRTHRGIERIYRGLSLVCVWEVDGDTRRPWTARCALSIEDAGDGGRGGRR